MMIIFKVNGSFSMAGGKKTTNFLKFSSWGIINVTRYFSDI